MGTMSAGHSGALPLRGRRILITRARDQAGAFADLLREQGAEILLAPAIRIEPPDSWAAVDEAIAGLDRFALVIFTSANGVEAFARRLEDRGGRLTDLHAPLVAIGPRTADALARRGLRVDLLPESYRAEGIVDALRDHDLRGREVLIPRAQEARDLLIVELEKRGARVTVAPVYRTRRDEGSREPLIRTLEAGGLDMVTFTASSTVAHFLDLLGPERAFSLMKGVKVACIGPITADAARARGLTPDLIPARYTIPDLAEAIVRYFSRREDGDDRGV